MFRLRLVLKGPDTVRTDGERGRPKDDGVIAEKKKGVIELMFVTFSPIRNILGFPTDQLVRGPIIKKELEEQLSQQITYFHFIHWCVLTYCVLGVIPQVRS